MLGQQLIKVFHVRVSLEFIICAPVVKAVNHAICVDRVPLCLYVWAVLCAASGCAPGP
jgi:hypothetical protein